MNPIHDNLKICRPNCLQNIDRMFITGCAEKITTMFLENKDTYVDQWLKHIGDGDIH